MSEKEIKLEDHLELGAKIKLCRKIEFDILRETSKFLPIYKNNKLVKSIDNLDYIKDELEKKMYAECKDEMENPHDYCAVYYGDLDKKTRNEIYGRVFEIAKEYSEKIFEKSEE